MELAPIVQKMMADIWGARARARPLPGREAGYTEAQMAALEPELVPPPPPAPPSAPRPVGRRGDRAPLAPVGALQVLAGDSSGAQH
eukprot:12796511-Alexandrium_andersonii.AAC.1